MRLRGIFNSDIIVWYHGNPGSRAGAGNSSNYKYDTVSASGFLLAWFGSGLAPSAA